MAHPHEQRIRIAVFVVSTVWSVWSSYRHRAGFSEHSRCPNWSPRSIRAARCQAAEVPGVLQNRPVHTFQIEELHVFILYYIAYMQTFAVAHVSKLEICNRNGHNQYLETGKVTHKHYTEFAAVSCLSVMDQTITNIWEIISEIIKRERGGRVGWERILRKGDCTLSRLGSLLSFSATNITCSVYTVSN